MTTIPPKGTKVRVTSGESTIVGTISATLAADGTFRVQLPSTSEGSSFAWVPADADIEILPTLPTTPGWYAEDDYNAFPGGSRVFYRNVDGIWVCHGPFGGISTWSDDEIRDAHKRHPLRRLIAEPLS